MIIRHELFVAIGVRLRLDLEAWAQRVCKLRYDLANDDGIPAYWDRQKMVDELVVFDHDLWRNLLDRLVSASGPTLPTSVKVLPDN